MRRVIMISVMMVLLAPLLGYAANFRFQKVKEGIYAAIAVPGGKAASNCLVVVTNYQVIMAGAHFVPETTKELLEFVQKITPIPVRYIILTHHHRGYNHIDFDLPANAEIIASGQAWQSLAGEFRQNRQLFQLHD